MHRLAAANGVALLRTGRLLEDKRQACILKVLFQKRRGMRKLVSSRMSSHQNRVDALEVEIAALGEFEEHGVDKRLNLLIASTRKPCKAPRS